MRTTKYSTEKENGCSCWVLTVDYYLVIPLIMAIDHLIPLRRTGGATDHPLRMDAYQIHSRIMVLTNQFCWQEWVQTTHFQWWEWNTIQLRMGSELLLTTQLLHWECWVFTAQEWVQSPTPPPNSNGVDQPIISLRIGVDHPMLLLIIHEMGVNHPIQLRMMRMGVDPTTIFHFPFSIGGCKK